MPDVGISLGWNCNSAIVGKETGLRGSRETGYRTCPFDECITNYGGLLECIRDDFKDFTNSDYLCVIESPIGSGGIQQGEPLLYNRKYKFVFNHESPGHADLYLHQHWAGGKTHFLDNDFAEFKARYTRRIENFRSYLRDPANQIVFLYTTYQTDISELHAVFQEAFPTLNYTIKTIDQPSDYTRQCVADHMRICGVDEACISTWVPR